MDRWMQLCGFDRTFGVILCALSGVHIGEVMFDFFNSSIDASLVRYTCIACIRFDKQIRNKYHTIVYKF